MTWNEIQIEALKKMFLNKENLETSKINEWVKINMWSPDLAVRTPQHQYLICLKIYILSGRVIPRIDIALERTLAIVSTSTSLYWRRS